LAVLTGWIRWGGRQTVEKAALIFGLDYQLFFGMRIDDLAIGNAKGLGANLPDLLIDLFFKFHRLSIG
jgi:hypothetical protein